MNGATWICTLALVTAVTAGELESLRESHARLRELVREHCQGMSFGAIETPSGENFENVRIVSVDEKAVTFRHGEGEGKESRLAWSDAPEVWKALFGPDAPKPAAAPPPSSSRIAAAIAVIEGDRSNGTGFFCRSEGRVHLYSAAHVMSGNSRLKVKLRDGTVVRKFGAVEAAEGADLVRLAVEEPVADVLEIADRPGEAKVGEPVLASGNAGGGGTVGFEAGSVVGVGAESIEIDAQVIQGNSGGPILHAQTHRVLGVVTHLMAERRDLWAKDTRYSDVRRFGCRLDRPWVWKTVPVDAFLREGKALLAVQEQTELMLAALQPDEWSSDIFARQRENPLARDILSLQTWIRQQQNGTQRMSETDRKKRLRGIFESARHRSRGQMSEFRPDSFTWFHRETGKKEIERRTEVDKIYDEAINGVR